jgi:hypothetical protein
MACTALLPRLKRTVQVLLYSYWRISGACQLFHIRQRHAADFTGRLNPDLGDFIQTIYKHAFKPQKAQAKLVATRLKRLEKEASSEDAVTEKGRNLLLSLSKAMLGRKQSLFDPPIKQEASKESMDLSDTDTHGIYADPIPTPRPISLALVRLRVKGDSREEMAYESHVHTEAKVAAVLVRLLEKACGEGDDIFVACPHRIQRAEVNLALSQWDTREKGQRERDTEEDEELQRLMHRMGLHMEEDESDVSCWFSIFRAVSAPYRLIVSASCRLSKKLRKPKSQ